MDNVIRIALAQINCTVGDLEGNARKISDNIQKAKDLGVDIISFPELSVCGYPPEDLILKPKFIDDNIAKLNELILQVDDIVAVMGFVNKSEGGLYNAAAVIYCNEIKGICHKMLLPNYSVFDEKRYFKEGREIQCFKYGKTVFAVNICEDIWFENGPLKSQAEAGAQLIVNINASPFYAGKCLERQKVLGRQAIENRVAISYTNMVGGQDELVFDGQSMVFDWDGKLAAMGGAFKEELLVTDLTLPETRVKARKTVVVAEALPVTEQPPVKTELPKPLGRVEEVYKALVTGLRDYVRKNGFKTVVLGLSGGVDSAIVAAIAVDALGKDNVVGVLMPSRYTSKESIDDAMELVKRLDIRSMAISIENIFKTYIATLEPYFEGKPQDITEENIQSRIRGNLMMALSNKFGWLVLTTGNKSEMSTGYATLYGDMAGGFAVIKDVPKILVYELTKYRNTVSQVIPENVIKKAPTAELRPNQKDSDSLPPYNILDPVLKAYVEEYKSLEEIVALGFERETVKRAMNLVDKSEYKRRQSPPGIKITPLAFGKDRRMPITNKYKG